MAQSKGWNLDEWIVPSGRIKGRRVTVSDSATPTFDALQGNDFFQSTSQSGITLQVPTSAPGTGLSQTLRYTIYCNTTTTTLAADTASTGGFKYTAAVPSLPTLSNTQYVDIIMSYQQQASRWIFEAINVYS